MFILLGISISFAALLTFNVLLSFATVALWRIARRFTESWSAAARAKTVFFLRVLPGAIGASCVLFLLIPSYLALEPRTTTEGVSLKLAIVAFASAAGIGLAIIRGLCAWQATARLTNDWLAYGELIAVPRALIPVYCIEHRFPVIAIVGIVRPKLFIGRQVLKSLTPNEISAAVAHEAGHLRARDNLKKGLLRACRDTTLFIPYGRGLDRAWTEASESAADEYSARQGRTVALDLASALVKISRLIPAGASPRMPAGAFLIADEGRNGVHSRVWRLMHIASAGPAAKGHEPLVSAIVTWSSFALLFSIAALPHQNPHVLATVHSLIESVVSFLN